MKLKFAIISSVSTIIFVLTFGILMTHDVAPAHGNNFAWGQTGATGPTGPTGPTGSGSTVAYNNHNIFTGSAPAVTVCGTSPTISAGSTDNAGTVTVGAATTDLYGHFVAVTQCTVTFSTAFTTAPSVTLSTNQNGLGIVVNTVSTTALTVQFSKDAGTRVFKYTAF